MILQFIILLIFMFCFSVMMLDPTSCPPSSHAVNVPALFVGKPATQHHE